MDLYEELGVSKDASAEQIKKAYRKKSRDHHPDVGGDPEDFRSLALAYRVLSDEATRSRYDKGEKPEDLAAPKLSEEQEVRKLLANVFSEVVTKCQDPKSQNLVHLLRESLRMGLRELEKQRLERNTMESKWTEVLKRIKPRHGEAECPLAISAQSLLRKVEIEKAEILRQTKLGEAGLKFVEEYGYEIVSGGGSMFQQQFVINIQI